MTACCVAPSVLQEELQSHWRQLRGSRSSSCPWGMMGPPDRAETFQLGEMIQMTQISAAILQGAAGPQLIGAKVDSKGKAGTYAKTTCWQMPDRSLQSLQTVLTGGRSSTHTAPAAYCDWT